MKLPKLIHIVFGITLLSSCSSGDEKHHNQSKENGNSVEIKAEKLRVAAAANLRFVLKDLKADFEKKGSVNLEIIIASSGKLYSQIINGAPYDVFLSADMKFPNTLFEQNLAAEKPSVYALGTLIIWSKKIRDLSDGMACLMRDDIRKIAIASNKNAPYGVAALESLKSAKIFKQIESKLVYGESVSQVNHYTNSETVDVGLTNKSVVLSRMKGEGVWYDVADSLYSPIQQGIIITNYGELHHSRESRSFLNYLFSDSAQEILANYGYLAP